MLVFTDTQQSLMKIRDDTRSPKQMDLVVSRLVCSSI